MAAVVVVVVVVVDVEYGSMMALPLPLSNQLQGRVSARCKERVTVPGGANETRAKK
jgi:hypothetical protein